jgi:hypothetical protein
MIIESVCRISSESLISVDGNASWATVTRTAVDPAPSSSSTSVLMTLTWHLTSQLGPT